MVRACSSLLFVCACSAGLQEHVAFRVDVQTQTADGHDVDDASPSVTMVVDGKRLDAGQGPGRCVAPEQLRSAPARETCTADAPPGTVAKLACGDDVHFDQFLCFYAVRAGDAVELWRREGSFLVEDGQPERVTRGAMKRVGVISKP